MIRDECLRGNEDRSANPESPVASWRALDEARGGGSISDHPTGTAARSIPVSC